MKKSTLIKITIVGLFGETCVDQQQKLFDRRGESKYFREEPNDDHGYRKGNRNTWKVKNDVINTQLLTPVFVGDNSLKHENKSIK